MFWTKEDCIKWLPFVQAVAEGKEIEEWTGMMEKVKPDVAYGSHRFTDDKGEKYASPINTEYASVGNILPIIHHNHTMIEPRLYLRIKE